MKNYLLKTDTGRESFVRAENLRDAEVHARLLWGEHLIGIHERASVPEGLTLLHKKERKS